MSIVGTRRLFAVGHVLAVLVYLVTVALLLTLAWTGVAEMLERRQSVAAASDLLAQLEGRKAGARASTADPTAAAVPTGSPFLEGQTLTVAGAALLQRVADAVTKVGGNVLSSQVDVQGVQAKDGYVSVLASCELDYTALQKLLYDLEAGMPFLFIEQVVAQTRPARSTSRRAMFCRARSRWRRRPARNSAPSSSRSSRPATRSGAFRSRP